MKNYLLFQAYGNIAHINECKYFILKYLDVYNSMPPTNTEIIIYTDQPQIFQEFILFSNLIEIKKILPAQIKEWRGDDDFVHRVKIKIIQDFFLNYNGNLLYCDTDTYIIKPLVRIFEGIEKGGLYMHEYEGILAKKSNIIFRKWNNFLAKTPIEYNGKKLQYSANIQMWNAGVIGLNNSHIGILDDVLTLTDVLYKKCPKHIAEQFAFDYCLQKEGVINATKNEVIHYWFLKEFRFVLEKFFYQNKNKGINELVKKCKLIDAAVIQKEKYKNARFFIKIYSILLGKKWTINKYVDAVD